MDTVLLFIQGLIPEIVLVPLPALLIKREPRRLFPAVILLAAILTFFSKLTFAVLHRLDHFDGQGLIEVYLISATGLCVLMIIFLGLYLVVNSFSMAHKERVNAAVLASGTVGLVIMGYVVAVVISVLNNNSELFFWLFFLGLPLGYLAFVFAVYVGYAKLYALGVRRFARPPRAVIALGAGLIQGYKVSKLLQSRLDLAQQVHQRIGDNEHVPLIVSGGKGADEQRSEAEAMGEYLISQGVEESAVFFEAKSRTTEENLQFSHHILTSLGAPSPTRVVPSPIRVVTSDYHAFRAATLMRTLHLPGHAMGARSARYFWPSAIVREFLAYLRDNLALNIAILVALSVPLITRFIAYLAV